MVDLAGKQIRKEIQKNQKHHHPQPVRDHPAIEVSPKLPCDAIPLGRRPS